MDTLALKKLKEHFGDSIVSTDDFRGDLSITIKRDKINPICKFLRDTQGLEYTMLMDICGVDYLGRKTPRFEVVYHLYSPTTKHRLRLKAQVPEQDPTIDTVTDLWKAAGWFEREVYDMFGIKINGHPHLRRILLHDEFQGHPLRKDYPVDKRQPLSKPASLVE
ncbi:MAG: NADH-quinone oxidoreductase subunit C [candidate division KSB1 bacterium]|nr:NADH-quinone oxidoreductase subunit C [candidate division KSB1 bacterium]